MRKLIDGDYEVPCSTEYDNGYGVESASDEVVIYVLNGEIDEVISYGMHFVTELEVDWDPDLTEEECLELLQIHCPHAFEDDPETHADYLADKKLALLKNK